jgi:Na+-transporting NADH:ubiquinone oxidoreductase subunit NqrD
MTTDSRALEKSTFLILHDNMEFRGSTMIGSFENFASHLAPVASELEHLHVGQDTRIVLRYARRRPLQGMGRMVGLSHFSKLQKE